MGIALNAHNQISGRYNAFEVPGIGVLTAAGPTKPSDGTPGYAPGCMFFDTNAAAGSQWYVNVGSRTSCDFDAVTGGVDLSALTATAAEINRVATVSSRVVNVTASTLALSNATHGDKIVTINAAAGCAITLPAATGSGFQCDLVIMTTITSNTTTITRAGSDTMFGMIFQLADGGATLAAYEMPGSTVITLNGSTTGGIKGDKFRIQDVGTAQWEIIGWTSATGSEATPVT